MNDYQNLQNLVKNNVNFQNNIESKVRFLQNQLKQNQDKIQNNIQDLLYHIKQKGMYFQSSYSIIYKLSLQINWEENS